MDSALALRLSVEQNRTLENASIVALLDSSSLVKKLTSDYLEHPLFAVFRILGIRACSHKLTKAAKHDKI